MNDEGEECLDTKRCDPAAVFQRTMELEEGKL